MTPLVLIVDLSELKQLFSKQKWMESFLLLAGFSAFTLYIFIQTKAPIAFLMYPALLLILFRLGTSATAITVTLLSIPGAYLTAYGYGAFSLYPGRQIAGVLLFQLFVAVMVIMLNVVGGSLRERAELHRSLAESYKQLERLAETDFLTQLPNRRTLETRLQQEQSIAYREKQHLSVLMIDMDHFKSFNDQFGHPAGDSLIVAVSAAIDESLERPRDFAARYGGEEFAAILPYTPLEGAIHVAERIRVNVEKIALPTVERQMSVSIGVAAFNPSIASSVEGLLKSADMMLYCAKQSGRNRVCS